MSDQAKDAFRATLNNACNKINEAARLSVDIFQGDDLKAVRRELARIMEIVEAQLLARLKRE